MFGKMNRFMVLVVMTALVLAFSGCSRDKQDQETSEAPPQKAMEVITIKGKVLEAVDAGNFLYMLLDLGDKQTWAAVPLVDVQIGEEVTLRNANYFNNFYSKSLQKSFDEMIFSSGIEGKEPKRREASLGNQGKKGNRRSMMLPSPSTTVPSPAKAK